MDRRIPKENYPLSTQDGKAIPLDILRTKGLIKASINNSTDAPITLPEDNNISIIFSSVDAYVTTGIVLGALPSNNVLKETTIFVPAGHAVTVVLDGKVASVRSLVDAGVIHIQLIERWAGMGLDINTVRK